MEPDCTGEQELGEGREGEGRGSGGGERRSQCAGGESAGLGKAGAMEGPTMTGLGLHQEHSRAVGEAPLASKNRVPGAWLPSQKNRSVFTCLLQRTLEQTKQGKGHMSCAHSKHNSLLL